MMTQGILVCMLGSWLRGAALRSKQALIINLAGRVVGGRVRIEHGLLDPQMRCRPVSRALEIGCPAIAARDMQGKPSPCTRPDLIIYSKGCKTGMGLKIRLLCGLAQRSIDQDCRMGHRV
jgi:hypothetical protein